MMMTLTQCRPHITKWATMMIVVGLTAFFYVSEEGYILMKSSLKTPFAGSQAKKHDAVSTAAATAACAPLSTHDTSIIISSNKTLEVQPPKTKKNHSAAVIRYVPYPHNQLPFGNEGRCDWSTGRASLFTSLLGNPDDDGEEEIHPDPIQQAAIRQGVCLPENTTGLHIFSTAEAIECLSKSGKNGSMTVTISGDSYTMQLFVGLGDILLANPSDDEITNATYRERLRKETNLLLQKRHNTDHSFPNVQFVCIDKWECYGEKIVSGECAKCLNSYKKGKTENDTVVQVLGVGVHLIRYYTELGKTRPEAYKLVVQSFERLFETARPDVLVSMPSYEIEKVPAMYRDAPHNKASGVYGGTQDLVQKKGYPFLDVYQLTLACSRDDCSYDGGHRSRYVNRWKAQLLLNALCKQE